MGGINMDMEKLQESQDLKIRIDDLKYKRESLNKGKKADIWKMLNLHWVSKGDWYDNRVSILSKEKSINCAFYNVLIDCTIDNLIAALDREIERLEQQFKDL